MTPSENPASSSQCPDRRMNGTLEEAERAADFDRLRLSFREMAFEQVTDKILWSHT